MMIVLGVITLLIIQYSFLVIWISKRIDKIIES
jgi:hypothetical protein